MAPRVFSFNGHHFIELKTGMQELFGWWRSVAATDIDNDGDNDLVLGNIGENFYLQPTQDKPVKLWVGDFDNNQMTDKVITRSVNGKDMPVFLKRELTDQMPGLKKQNLRHIDYADKSIQDLFSTDVLQKGVVASFNYASSCIAINDGKGNFNIRKLPGRVQWSSVSAIATVDVNEDGKTDLVLAGNECSLLPQFCRVDASYGNILLNDGKGNFSVIPAKEAGLSARGEIRDIAIIKRRTGTELLFLQNNDFPLRYSLRKSHNK
jgi:hypothetical protein